MSCYHVVQIGHSTLHCIACYLTALSQGTVALDQVSKQCSLVAKSHLGDSAAAVGLEPWRLRGIKGPRRIQGEG